ncbi:hypothetical protein SBDP1_380017 [Syntrophobacter sp. SbD1]|nr:hypothetical protein SBDP1_380017 [Syntrophobacter sp. SbD1]
MLAHSMILKENPANSSSQRIMMVKGNSGVRGYEEQSPARDCLGWEEKAFLEVLLEDAMVFPFGTECCQLDDIA